MAPAYKLSYFPITGLGEPIRFLLSYGGIEFEDNRIPFESWPQIKPTMPFGQVPLLEYDGKKVHQSLAICRYFAKMVKLVGSNDWEDMEIEAVVFTVDDLGQHISKYHYETDDEIKKKYGVVLFSETLPFYLGRLDDIAKENNGFLAGGKLTWADLHFVSSLDYLNFMSGRKDLIEDYTNLKAVRDNVLNLPSIKNWIEKRPKSN